MRKAIAGIIRVLSWLVYLALAISLLVTAPILFGNHPVVVLSGSMEPAYPVGSIVYYKQTPYSDIAVGDAITFHIGEGSLATHRVVEKNEGNMTFNTKGDANPTPDAMEIAYTDVVGKTSSFALPYVGYFTKYIQKWYIIAAMGVILLLNMLVTPGETSSEKPKTQTPKAKSRKAAKGLTAAGYFNFDADEPSPAYSPAPEKELVVPNAAPEKEPVAKKAKAEKELTAAQYFKDL